jgi:hypothetical protein
MRPRRHEPQVVLREMNRIRFVGRVNALAYRQYLRATSEARRAGYDEFVLDFSGCNAAFPSGMVPLLAASDSLRRSGLDVEIVLPVNEELKRLFHNANWAHLLEPARYDGFDAQHDRHVAAHRFKTPDEQQNLVNAFLDVVMRQMRLQREVIAGLEWSINEITDNVLNHAQCADGGIVQVNTFPQARKVAFAVSVPDAESLPPYVRGTRT